MPEQCPLPNQEGLGATSKTHTQLKETSFGPFAHFKSDQDSPATKGDLARLYRYLREQDKARDQGVSPGRRRDYDHDNRHSEEDGNHRQSDEDSDVPRRGIEPKHRPGWQVQLAVSVKHSHAAQSKTLNLI